MRFLWIGGGSVGLLFAAKLALAGISTGLVVRGEQQLHAIRTNGLTLAEGSIRRSASLPCALFSSDWSVFEPEYIGLTVKQHHLDARFIRRLAQMMERLPRARIVCFQNGIGHMEALANSLPPSRLYQAIITEGARKSGPCEVEHTGRGAVWIGSPLTTGDEWQDGAKNAAKVLHAAGFNAHVSNNIKEMAWKKLLVNAAINPLTAVLRVPNGELLESDDWVQLLRAVFEEGRRVALKEGVSFGQAEWEDLLDVCRKTAANHSSMLQDVNRGGETEVDWINGSIVELGKRHGVETPVNETLLCMVRGFRRRRHGAGPE